MIERLTNLPAGIDGLTAIMKVSHEEYIAAIEPLLDSARREGRRLRLLLDFGPEFDGFVLGDDWSKVRLALQDLRRLSRCAMVSDVGWVRNSAQIAGMMLPCPLRVFGNHKRDEALTWLAEAPSDKHVDLRLLAEAGVLVVETQPGVHADELDVVALTVDPWLERRGKLDGIVIHTRGVETGQNLAGMVSHVRFVHDHHRKLRRVAVAGDGDMASVVKQFAEHFSSAEVAPFDADQLQAAIDWVGHA